jgi:hypothetical protein
MDLDSALAQLNTVLDVSLEQVEAINLDIKRVEDNLQARHAGTFTDHDTGIAWLRSGGFMDSYRLQAHDVRVGRMRPLADQSIHQRLAAHKKLPAFIAAMTAQLKQIAHGTTHDPLEPDDLKWNSVKAPKKKGMY